MRGERPIAKPETSADEIERPVGPKRKFVTAVTQERQPLGVAYDDVKLVSVNDEVTAAVCCCVNRLTLDLERGWDIGELDERLTAVLSLGPTFYRYRNYALLDAITAWEATVSMGLEL